MAGLPGFMSAPIGGYQVPQMSDPTQAMSMPSILASQPAAKPKLFGKDGTGWKVLGILGDALQAAGGGHPTYMPAMLDIQQQTAAEKKWQQQLAQQAQIEQLRLSAPTADQKNLAWYQSLTPEAQDAYNKMHRGDPTVTLTLPGDRGIYSGPQSGLGAALQGLAGGATNMPRVNSPEEAMKLAPGTRFLLPDGRIGTVPGGPQVSPAGGFR